MFAVLTFFINFKLVNILTHFPRFRRLQHERKTFSLSYSMKFCDVHGIRNQTNSSKITLSLLITFALVGCALLDLKSRHNHEGIEFDKKANYSYEFHLRRY